MASRRTIPESIQNIIRQRANGLCEYCHTIEKWQYVRFTIDHIIPLAEGGTDDVSNLALACFHCNRRKSNRSMAVDPETGLHYALFDPRRHKWAENFVWSMNGIEIIALTATGRVTVSQLQMNRPRIISIRLADVAVGRHPPQEDPRLTNTSSIN